MAPTLFGMNSDQLKSAIMISYVAVWCVIALLAAIILYKLLRFLFRVFGGVFGESITSKVISLGLASLLFPHVLPALFRTFLSFFSQLAENLPASFYLPTEEIRGLDASRASEMIGRLVALLFKGWSMIFISALSALRDIPIRDGILMVASGALFGLFLRQTEQTAASGSRQFWLAAFFKSLTPRTRQNLAFFLILAIAGYLSIAAIAAIPALKESTTSDEISVEKLKERLETASRESESGFVDLGSPPSPYEKVRKLVEQANATAPEVKPENAETERPALSPDEKEAVKRFLNIAEAGRKDALDSYTKQLKNLKKQRDDALPSAVDDYKINNLERKGRREAARYFLDMVDWYRRKLWWLQEQIGQSFNDIQALDRWCDQQADLLVEKLSARGADPVLRRQFISEQTMLWSGYRFSGGNQRQESERLPERPRLGSDLGPFTLVASWLLQTESLSLALIVGMIGFGLLGSACSSFVREKESRAESDQPLVHDLSGVIIRGLSAAIVVFLAAQGGLAIFGSGAPEPNPYVLLLTCLVAAVFSDSVWERAQEWFKRLGERRKERQKLAVRPSQSKRSGKKTRSAGAETAPKSA